MRVLRIAIEAPVCSFRYPHFLVGRQLTFDMPPPSTVFGLIASALGGWPDRARIRFGYYFEVRAKVDDLESQHIVVAKGGTFDAAGRRHPKSLEATLQPTRRQMLFGAQMLLYLDRPDLADSFREPRFQLVLGRSQDLAFYTDVREVTLQRVDRGYFERTLLPWRFRRRTARGTTVLMPCYVGPPPEREPEFERFIVLSETVYHLPPGEGDFGPRQMVHLEGDPLELWVDPDSPERHGLLRAIQFLGFGPDDQ